MYIVCNVLIVCCMTSYVNMWHVDSERVLGLYILYDVPCVRCMTINISVNGRLMFWRVFSNYLSKSETMYIMKSVLLSKSTFWSLQCMYSTKMQKKRSLPSHRSCFNSSLFDDGHSQIPGQSESQELHFGHLYVFILKWQMQSDKKYCTVRLWQIIVEENTPPPCRGFMGYKTGL